MAKDGNKGGGGKGGGSNPIQVQKFLKGVDYPASKEDILQAAEDNGADKNVLDMLKKIPDREYDGPNGVSKEIGGEA